MKNMHPKEEIEDLKRALEASPENHHLLMIGMTIGILGAGITGTLLNVGAFTTIALIGVFAYQWIFNGMLIKENSRAIDL